MIVIDTSGDVASCSSKTFRGYAEMYFGGMLGVGGEYFQMGTMGVQ